MQSTQWLKIFLLLCLAASCSPAQEGDDATDDVTDDVADDDDDDYDDEMQSDQGATDDYSLPLVRDRNCVCVPMYQCVDEKIVDDGSNLIDPRRKSQTEPPLIFIGNGNSQNGVQIQKKDVTMAIVNNGDVRPLPPVYKLPVAADAIPLFSAFSVTHLLTDETYDTGACGPFQVCCQDPEASTVRPYGHRCGNRNPGGINSRILTAGGQGEAQFGEWPWQAVILKKEGDNFVFKCGAALIDDKHIITVAHCAQKFRDNAVNMVVRLGEWDTQTDTEFLPHEDFGVERIVIHPQYRSNNFFNDIAVVELSRQVTFKPHIDTVCLPRDEEEFTGQNCVVAGWGKNAFESGNFSLIMKEITLHVLSNPDCQDRLRKTKLGRYFKLHGSFLCAGGEDGKDTCTGDGGGPLVCFRSDNSYTVAGLVSWGVKCGQSGVPGVYVNVPKFIDWITSVTRKPLEEYWSSQNEE